MGFSETDASAIVAAIQCTPNAPVNFASAFVLQIVLRTILETVLIAAAAAGAGLLIGQLITHWVGAARLRIAAADSGRAKHSQNPREAGAKGGYEPYRVAETKELRP
jgi:hypothetical protein